MGEEPISAGSRINYRMNEASRLEQGANTEANVSGEFDLHLQAVGCSPVAAFDVRTKAEVIEEHCDVVM